ncbi:hypothetical protein L204_105458 [Cryptococcus depauperatus]
MACLLLCRQGVDVLPKKNSSLDARGCIGLLKWRSTFLFEPSMLKTQSLRHSLLTQDLAGMRAMLQSGPWEWKALQRSWRMQSRTLQMSLIQQPKLRRLGMYGAGTDSKLNFSLTEYPCSNRE